VWLLPPVDFLAAFGFVFLMAPRFLFPPNHAAMPPGIPAWILLGLAIVAMGACYGVWAGNKTAQRALLTSIALCIPVFLYATISGILMMFRHGEREWLGYALLQFFEYAGLFLLLLAVNWWAFSTSRARAFFDDRSGDKPWFATRGMLFVGIGVPALVFGGCEALYQFTGPPSRPPRMLVEQLRTEPAAGLGEWQAFDRFPELRLMNRSDPVEDEQSRSFTALLKERFPSGTIEADLISALKKEGFHIPPSQGTECVPDAKSPSSERCHELPSPERTLDYGWWRFHGWRRGQCAEAVRVEWKTSHGKVTDVKGEYGKICGFLLEPRHWNYW
jgi:hypothetical protein